MHVCSVVTLSDNLVLLYFISFTKRCKGSWELGHDEIMQGFLHHSISILFCTSKYYCLFLLFQIFNMSRGLDHDILKKIFLHL